MNRVRSAKSSRGETGQRNLLSGTRRPEGRYETRDVREAGSSGSHRCYAVGSTLDYTRELRNIEGAIIE